MRRRIPAFIIAFSLLVAACATGTDSGTDSTSAPTNADSTTSSEAPESGGETTAGTEGSDGGSDETSTTDGTTEKPEGPTAPDFSLALGEDGSEAFMLSQEVMPVFMVFWAEW